MENVLIVLKQIIIMFIFIGIGFWLYKKELITKEGSRVLGHLLLYIILPCVLIKSLSLERTPENTMDFILSFIMGFASLLLSMGISRLLYKKKPLENFSASFSNAGFMGIPLISAVLGNEYVFFAASYIALLNVMQWTYGQYIISEKMVKNKLSGLVKNPLIISFLIGLLLFVFKIPLPEIVQKPIHDLAGMNAPIAMIVLGVYLAQADLLEMFKNKRIYVLSAVRLLLIPLATFLLLSLLPSQYNVLKVALLIAACAPVGSNVAIYAQKLNKDYVYSVKMVCLSTLLSIITIPLLTAISQKIWF